MLKDKKTVLDRPECRDQHSGEQTIYEDVEFTSIQAGASFVDRQQKVPQGDCEWPDDRNQEIAW